MTQGRDLGVLHRLQSVDIVAKQKTDSERRFLMDMPYIPLRPLTEATS